MSGIDGALFMSGIDGAVKLRRVTDVHDDDKVSFSLTSFCCSV